LLLKNGSRKNFIAERYGTTAGNLTHWLKLHKMDKVEAKP